MTKDKTTVAGLTIVGLAAAVLTFTTLFGLAVACGFDPWLAWLLPVTVDAAGLVALRIWLDDGRAFAKRLMMVCVGLSVAGNATQHGLAAAGFVPAVDAAEQAAGTAPWWVIVVVSAVPPSMLAAVVHLAYQAGRPVEQDEPAASRAVDSGDADEAATDQPAAHEPNAIAHVDHADGTRTAVPVVLAAPTGLHLAPPPPSNGKPWSPRAQELIREGMKDSSAYTKAKREWQRDNPGRTA